MSLLSHSYVRSLALAATAWSASLGFASVSAADSQPASLNDGPYVVHAQWQRMLAEGLQAKPTSLWWHDDFAKQKAYILAQQI